MANVKAKAEKAKETAEAAAVVETVKEEPAKKKEAPKQASFFMYLGPTIQGVIQTASVYEGTCEEVLKQLQDQVERFPRIKALLISGDTIAEDRINVNTPGTRLYAEYRKLVAEVNK